MTLGDAFNAFVETLIARGRRSIEPIPGRAQVEIPGRRLGQFASGARDFANIWRRR
jgi:hypothetical protein